MLNRGSIELVSIIFGLKLIEQVLMVEDCETRCDRLSTLLENPELQALSQKRFPCFHSTQELMQAVALPLDSPQRDVLLYPTGTVAFSCRFQGNIKPSNGFHVLFAVDGNFHCSIGQDSFILNQDSVCVFSQQSEHSFAPLSSVNATAISLFVDEDYFRRLLLDGSSNTLLMSVVAKRFLQLNSDNRYLIVDISKATIAQNMLYLGFGEYVNRCFCFDEVIRCYISIFFMELLKTFMIEADIDTLRLLDNNKGSEIIMYIEENCKSLTLSSAAEHFFFHPNYFSKLIKSYTGCSFKELVQSARLKKACQLLRGQSVSVSTIAESVGYQDASYFFRLFKSVYGMTPVQYRKNMESKSVIP